MRWCMEVARMFTVISAAKMCSHSNRCVTRIAISFATSISPVLESTRPSITARVERVSPAQYQPN